MTYKSTTEPERFNERTIDGREVSRNLTGLHISNVSIDAEGEAQVTATAAYLVTNSQLLTWEQRQDLKASTSPNSFNCTFDLAWKPVATVLELVLFQWSSFGGTFSSWGGSCFGSSSTTQSYFAIPLPEPAEGSNTHSTSIRYDGYVTIQFDNGSKQVLRPGEKIA